MALACAIHEDNIAGAFRLGEVWYRIQKVMENYIPAYVIMAVITAVAPVIVMGVPIISFLGVFLMFYASVVFSNYVGMLYGSY
jgi:hypothetical protein